MSLVHDLKRATALLFPHIWSNRSSRIRIGISTILVVADTIVTLSIPYLLKLIVDQLAHPTGTSVPFLLIAFAATWTIERGFNNIQNLVFYAVANDCIRDVTYSIVDELHQLPLDTFHLSPPPRTISALRRIGTASRTILKTIFLHLPPALIKFVAGTLSFVILLGPQTTYQWVVCTVSIPVFFALYITLVAIGMRWYGRLRSKAWYATDSVAISLRDQLLNTRTLRFDRTAKMELLRTLLHDEASAWYATNVRNNLVILAIIALVGLIFGLLLNTIITVTASTALTAGYLVLLQGQLVAAFLPLISLAQKMRSIVESLSDMEFIANILSYPHITTLPTTTPTTTTTGWKLETITFAFPYKSPIFQNFSLEITEGELIAITGDSGTGKSTLANLLVGLRRPQQGTISFRGRDLRSYSDNELSSIIRFIPQETFLIYTTLRENILYGVPTHEHHRLNEVINLVGLTPLLPHLDEVVGDLGGRLSGGERQRVALANALLTRPQILILDETLHALSDHQTTDVLNELSKQIKTVIIITHRDITHNRVGRIITLPL